VGFKLRTLLSLVAAAVAASLADMAPFRPLHAGRRGRQQREGGADERDGRRLRPLGRPGGRRLRTGARPQHGQRRRRGRAGPRMGRAAGRRIPADRMDARRDLVALAAGRGRRRAGPASAAPSAGRRRHVDAAGPGHAAADGRRAGLAGPGDWLERRPWPGQRPGRLGSPRPPRMGRLPPRQDRPRHLDKRPARADRDTLRGHRPDAGPDARRRGGPAETATLDAIAAASRGGAYPAAGGGNVDDVFTQVVGNF
jgi:hypothetical protein